MDLFDVAEHGGSVEAGLARIQAKRTLVVGVETRLPVPDRPAGGDRHPARPAPAATSGSSRLPSIQGHDSFLVDYDRFAPPVGSFLREVAP